MLRYRNDDKPDTNSREVSAQNPMLHLEPGVKPNSKAIVIGNCSRRDIGHVKMTQDDYGRDSNTDFCQTRHFNYTDEGLKVVLGVGADGLGNGGELWAQAAVDLCLAEITMRGVLSAFAKDYFVNRVQLSEALSGKMQNGFMPAINEVHRTLFDRFNMDASYRKHPDYGTSLVALALVCDLQSGEINAYGYSVGHSSIFAITGDKIDKLTTEDLLLRLSNRDHLNKWVGQKETANGANFFRQFQVTAEMLPRLQFLLCSNGITDMLSPERIGQICRGDKPSKAVDTVINEAKNCAEPYGRQFKRVISANDPPLRPGEDSMFACLIDISR